MAERLGEDDHVPGVGAGVGHHCLILLPQRDAPGARQVSLVAASDGAKAATASRLVGEQELHREQHSPASSPAVLPCQRAGLPGQVFVFFAEAILVSVEGMVQCPEQAGIDEVRDDQPALDVEKVFLAPAQAMHAAEPTHHRGRPSNELGVAFHRFKRWTLTPEDPRR